MSHVAVRFEPDLNGPFQPYVQGLIGAHWYYTNTTIKDLGVDEVVDRYKEQNDVVLGIGALAGVQFVPPNWRGFGIDFRLGYLSNGSVTYMRHTPPRGSSTGYPIEYFEERSSPIQMFSIQMGAVYRFP